MNKINPKAEKGSENRGTGWFRYRQSKSSNFIYKKENPVGRCEDIKNDIFDLVLQGQTKFQNNWNDVQYAVNNLLKTTLSAPTYPELGVGETALTIFQKIILDTKKWLTDRKCWKRIWKWRSQLFTESALRVLSPSWEGISNMKPYSVTKILLECWISSRDSW